MKLTLWRLGPVDPIRSMRATSSETCSESHKIPSIHDSQQFMRTVDLVQTVDLVGRPLVTSSPSHRHRVLIDSFDCCFCYFAFLALLRLRKLFSSQRCVYTMSVFHRGPLLFGKKCDEYFRVAFVRHTHTHSPRPMLSLWFDGCQ